MSEEAVEHGFVFLSVWLCDEEELVLRFSYLLVQSNDGRLQPAGQRPLYTIKAFHHGVKGRNQVLALEDELDELVALCPHLVDALFA